MSWVNLAYALVKLANLLFQNANREALLKAGEDRQIAKQVVVLSELSASLKSVDERFERMTDAEVKAEIEQQGDYRD